MVTTAAAIDRETSGPAKTIEVTATSAGSSSVQTFTIAINDRNDNAPVWTTPATARWRRTRRLVAALSATDADATAANSTVAFSITGGADMALFDIVGGNLVFKSAPDYEASKTSFAVEVTASDGAHPVVRAFTVNLGDQNDNALAWATPATQTVAENTTLVTALSATDADATAANNAVAFSITGGADMALFDIVGGNLVASSRAPDYEAGARRALRVEGGRRATGHTGHPGLHGQPRGPERQRAGAGYTRGADGGRRTRRWSPGAAAPTTPTPRRPTTPWRSRSPVAPTRPCSTSLAATWCSNRRRITRPARRALRSR